MAGGTWVTQNKYLPGVYTNFTASKVTLDSGRNGVVSLALSLPWLEPHKIHTITQEYAPIILADLGISALAVAEALKNATTVLLYRLNTGAKASATLGNLICTAKHEGTFGNKLLVSITAVVGEVGKFYVSTHIGTKEYDKQKVANASELVNNRNNFV